MVDDKIEFYINRTFAHIRRVQDNIIFLIKNYSEELKLTDVEIRDLLYNAAKHDTSKFSAEQYDGYVNFSWGRKHGLKINSDLFEKAWYAHYRKENHHPIKYKDAPFANSFSKIIALEIACDLQAMSQEFDEGTFKNYYENTWRQENSSYYSNDYAWTMTCFYIETAELMFSGKYIREE